MSRIITLSDKKRASRNKFSLLSVKLVDYVQEISFRVGFKSINIPTVYH